MTIFSGTCWCLSVYEFLFYSGESESLFFNIVVWIFIILHCFDVFLQGPSHVKICFFLFSILIPLLFFTFLCIFILFLYLLFSIMFIKFVLKSVLTWAYNNLVFFFDMIFCLLLLLSPGKLTLILFLYYFVNFIFNFCIFYLRGC